MRNSSLDKKAGLSVIFTIILVIVGAMVVFGVTARFVKLMSQETQQSICSANVIAANKIIESDNYHWTLDAVSDSAAEQSLKHPLCTTLIKRIDLTEYEGQEIKENAAIQIGEMIENCWDTFGEGKYLNTFGQDAGKKDSKINYYFPCYKFKLHLEDPSKTIPISDLMLVSEDNTGLLWKYNIKGKEIKEDFLVSTEKYLEGDKFYESYAAHVLFPGNGYFEFLESTNAEGLPGYSVTGGTVDDAVTGATGGLIAGATIAGLIFAGIITGPPGWIVLGATAGGATIGFLQNGFYDKLKPNEGIPMEALIAERWYEVRYYGPYVKNPDEYQENFILNSIKIVPEDDDGVGTEAGNIGLS